MASKNSKCLKYKGTNYFVIEGFYFTSLKKSRDQGSSRKISSNFYLFIYMTKISGA